MLQLRHDNPELLFQPFCYPAPMATHIERLPTQNDGIGAEVLGNLLCVQRIKALAVSPIDYFSLGGERVIREGLPVKRG